MGKSWKQTPNGRPAKAADPPGPDPVHRPAGRTARSEELPVLRAFAQACLTALSGRLDRMGSRERLGLCLFLLGAADRLWSRLDLDDRRYPAAAEAILGDFGVPAHKAATIVAALPRTAQEPLARETLVQGARTFDRWYAGADPDSVLVLPDLLADWAAVPGPEGL